MEKLYKYFQDFGRMGALEGTFTATDEQIQKLKDKGQIYLGEVLGKHSDIVATMSDETLELLTDDQEFISKAKEYGLMGLGTNPLDYLDEDEG